MSSTRGRGTAARGRGNDASLIPVARGRGRGQLHARDQPAGQPGLVGQRQTGPPPRSGTRNIHTRGGWNHSARTGAEGSTQGGARAAAAAYESQRRQRVVQENARIQEGRQNNQNQQRGGGTTSSSRHNRGTEGLRINNTRSPAGPTTNAHGAQQPRDDDKPLPPINIDDDSDNDDDDDNDNDNGPSSPSDPSEQAQRATTSLPSDLPTTYYESLRLADAPSTYISYPARVHHLKHPTEEFNPSVGHKWEDIHLYQKVSSPRLHMRWTRPATAADTERSRDFFVRFHAAGYEPFMGFRPYTDILFLDGQYMGAVLRRSASANANGAPDTDVDADSIVPFLTAADRVKVRILAVAASAFGIAASAERTRVCSALVRAFPGLARVFLVSVAPVARPLSAAWDLETEFARWVKVSEAARVEARSTEEVVGRVGAYGVQHGLIEEEDGSGGSPLADEIEAAFVLARESGRRTAENRARAEQAFDKERAPVDWDKVDFTKMMEPRSSTSDRSSGSSRSSGVVRKVRVEPYIMLYFQDAYDRAVSKGWSGVLDGASVDHVDLGME